MNKEIKIKSVSTDDFVKFGFYFGIIFGILGDLIVILFPSSRITATIPFFTYNATRTVGGLIVFPIIAIISSVIDFLIIALLVNLILKLTKGIRVGIEKEE